MATLPSAFQICGSLDEGCQGVHSGMKNSEAEVVALARKLMLRGRSLAELREHGPHGHGTPGQILRAGC